MTDATPTPEPELSPADIADLATLDGPEVEQIHIVNYLPRSIFDAAPDKIGLVLAMAEKGFRELVENNGGDPLDLSLGMNTGLAKANPEDKEPTVPTIELAYITTRPMGWTHPEGASFGEGAVSDGE